MTTEETARPEPLHLKYRPDDWDQVVGQDTVVDSLKDLVLDGAQRAFLFFGPSGCGKTTLARLVASQVNCTTPMEVDAATYTGIDAMREVSRSTLYSMGSEPRVVIIDECHALSKQAWQSLLKSIEEPNPDVWWCLCTTEGKKVPATIRNRCAVYELRSVRDKDLRTLLAGVVSAEEGDVDEGVLDLCVKAAHGSPRKALTALEKAWSSTSRHEASEVLGEPDEEDPQVIELCRALAESAGWSKLMKMVRGLESAGYGAESVRIVVVAYFTKVAMGAKGFDRAEPALAILDAFGTPYIEIGSKAAPIVASIGLLFQE